MDRDVFPDTIEAHASSRISPGMGPRSTRTAMIERIAAALDIPPDALAQAPSPAGDRGRIIAENAEALQIFAGITDPKAREQGLAYLRWIAEQSDPR